MSTSTFSHAFEGTLIADALSMPVHWYYDRDALERDYGRIESFVAPRNPHPDSILWRSEYTAPHPDADILREQGQYWGKRGVHYHQFLEAGENTLNFRLAASLFELVMADGRYNADAWLARYVGNMTTPGWHKDTYIEEYHRAFFTNRAYGTPLRRCGIKDVHIGGLSHVAALLAASPGQAVDDARLMVKKHVALTHQDPGVIQAADVLVRLLYAFVDYPGLTLEEALLDEANDFFSLRLAKEWSRLSDRHVIGKILSPACYIKDAMRASLYLAWKYEEAPAEGILANLHVGGDNCHRGAVVGALLGRNGDLPQAWKSGLKFQLADVASSRSA